MRSPRADDCELLGDLEQLHRRIARALLRAEPAEVAVHVAGAGDHLELLLADSGDGDVGGDAAVPLQQLRVDHAAGRPVDQIA